MYLIGGIFMLAIKEVSKSFGNTNVIKNINMEIKDKEIVG